MTRKRISALVAMDIVNELMAVQPYNVCIYSSDGKLLAKSDLATDYPESIDPSEVTPDTLLNSTPECPVYEKDNNCNLCYIVRFTGCSVVLPEVKKCVAVICRLLHSNSDHSQSVISQKATENGVLSVLVGVHPLDLSQFQRQLKEIGFDESIAHTTLYFRLAKLDTIQVDVGSRELIMDQKQVSYAVSSCLDFINAYFPSSQDFVMTDKSNGESVVLYADREESADAEIMRLFHMCEYLVDIAKKDYCLNLYAVIGIRCASIADYERQYEQLVKRLGSGRMLFPDKNIYWGHSIVLGSLIFHLSRGNRTRLSSVLNNIIESPLKDVLLETLEAFFSCDMNHQATAERLFIHRNTLQYRLRKIEELTGTQLKDIDSLLSLRLAMLCRNSILIEDGKK